MHDKITNFSFSLLFLPGECGCGCSDVSLVASEAGPLNAPTNGSKTAHTKVATSGGHANTQAPSKRSSSGADGDYHLVQHEVLYSLLAEYEVRTQPKTFPFSPNYSTSYKNKKNGGMYRKVLIRCARMKVTTFSVAFNILLQSTNIL